MKENKYVYKEAKTSFGQIDKRQHELVTHVEFNKYINEFLTQGNHQDDALVEMYGVASEHDTRLETAEDTLVNHTKQLVNHEMRVTKAEGTLVNHDNRITQNTDTNNAQSEIINNLNERLKVVEDNNADFKVVTVFANNVQKVETFVAQAGQRNFRLNLASYIPGQNRLAVYVNGVQQTINDGFVEVDSRTFQFTEGLTEGMKVTAHYFTEETSDDLTDIMETIKEGPAILEGLVEKAEKLKADSILVQDTKPLPSDNCDIWFDTSEDDFFVIGDMEITSLEGLKLATEISEVKSELRELNELSQRLGYVTYEMFGAIGDGIADDGEAIYNAHVYANQKGLPVKLQKSATYNVGSTRNIPIETNVDLCNSTILIDENIANTTHTFTISQSSQSVTQLDTIVNMGDVYAMLINSNQKIYRRYGANQNEGHSLFESAIISNNGTIQNEFYFDVTDLTSILVKPIQARLVIENAVFLIQANTTQESSYIRNGIHCTRNNVRFNNIHHQVLNNEQAGQPCVGFLHIESCCNIEITNSTFTPRHFRSVNGTMLGTYALNLNKVLNVTLDNVKAFTKDSSKYGFMGSNFVKNLNVMNCEVNRVDVHCGAFGVAIRDSKIGVKGISLVGGGTLIIQNVESHSDSLVTLRSDYGGTWDGDIYIKNIIHYPKSSFSIINANTNLAYDFGVKLCYGRNMVMVEDYVVDTGATLTSTLIDSTVSTTDNVQDYYLAKSFIFRNIKSVNNDLTLYLFNQLSSLTCEAQGSVATIGQRVHVTPNTSITIDNVGFKNIKGDGYKNTILTKNRGTGQVATDSYPETKIYPHLIITNCTDLALNTLGYPVKLDVSSSVIRKAITTNGGSRTEGSFVNCLFEYQDDVVLTGYASDDYSSTYVGCKFLPPIINGTQDTTSNTIRTVFGIFKLNDSFKMSVRGYYSGCSIDGIDLSTINGRFNYHNFNLNQMSVSTPSYLMYGSSTDRAQLSTAPNGFIYMDYTLKKALIKRGSNWYELGGDITVTV